MTNTVCLFFTYWASQYDTKEATKIIICLNLKFRKWQWAVTAKRQARTFEGRAKTEDLQAKQAMLNISGRAIS